MADRKFIYAIRDKRDISIWINTRIKHHLAIIISATEWLTELICNVVSKSYSLFKIRWTNYKCHITNIFFKVNLSYLAKISYIYRQIECVFLTRIVEFKTNHYLGGDQFNFIAIFNFRLQDELSSIVLNKIIIFECETSRTTKWVAISITIRQAGWV